MLKTITIPIEKPYNFVASIQAHGWVSLLPNIYDPKLEKFSRTEELKTGQVVNILVSVIENKKPELFVVLEFERKLLQSDVVEIIERLRYMLRVDEDLHDFYELCRKKGKEWTELYEGNCYLLRSPSIYEDIVKVICTTNIRWSGTKRMVRELVESFGAPFPGRPALRAFPTPQAISEVTNKEFRRCVNLGYRADYVYELSVSLAKGKLNLEILLDRSLPTSEVKKHLLSIKGVGNYAAASMLMLLGRYDQIPVDTVFRDFMKSKYFRGKDFSEGRGLEIYEEWGDWKYLAYWYEMLSYYREN